MNEETLSGDVNTILFHIKSAKDFLKLPHKSKPALRQIYKKYSKAYNLYVRSLPEIDKHPRHEIVVREINSLMDEVKKLGMLRENPSNKIQNVPDSLCKKCHQNWNDECVAFQMPHSKAEREFRLDGEPLCLESYASETLKEKLRTKEGKVRENPSILKFSRFKDWVLKHREELKKKTFSVKYKTPDGERYIEAIFSVEDEYWQEGISIVTWVISWANNFIGTKKGILLEAKKVIRKRKVSTDDNRAMQDKDFPYFCVGVLFGLREKWLRGSMPREKHEVYGERLNPCRRKNPVDYAGAWDAMVDQRPQVLRKIFREEYRMRSSEITEIFRYYYKGLDSDTKRTARRIIDDVREGKRENPCYKSRHNEEHTILEVSYDSKLYSAAPMALDKKLDKIVGEHHYGGGLGFGKRDLEWWDLGLKESIALKRRIEESFPRFIETEEMKVKVKRYIENPRSKNKKLTKGYYLRYGGSCERLLIDEYGNMDEPPYHIKKAKSCTRPGKHPHRVRKTKSNPGPRGGAEEEHSKYYVACTSCGFKIINRKEVNKIIKDQVKRKIVDPPCSIYGCDGRLLLVDKKPKTQREIHRTELPSRTKRVITPVEEEEEAKFPKIEQLGIRLGSKDKAIRANTIHMLATIYRFRGDERAIDLLEEAANNDLEPKNRLLARRLIKKYSEKKYYGSDEDILFGEDKKVWENPGPRGGVTEVQSFLFYKDLFTIKKAKKWLKDHGHKYGIMRRGVRVYGFPQFSSEEKWIREFRVVNKFKKGKTYIHLPEGIQARVAIEKGAPRLKRR